MHKPRLLLAALATLACCALPLHARPVHAEIQTESLSAAGAATAASAAGFEGRDQTPFIARPGPEAWALLLAGCGALLAWRWRRAALPPTEDRAPVSR